jgi:ADP-ribose pyrophosphatase
VSEHEFSTVSSETLHVGKIFALRADEVVMPGGGTARREVVEHFGAVAIVALDDSGDVVLVHQYRHPVGRRLWELPAGLLDMGDEPPHVTAARELEEEHDEEADLTVRRLPLSDAVDMVFAGEIVNSLAVAGILAAHSMGDPASLRTVDAPWVDRSTKFRARQAVR